jgi:NADH-quinone oxidoreductase subunit N
MDSNLTTVIRPELLTLSSDQFHVLTPYLFVFGGIILAILASVLRVVKPKWPVVAITVLSAIAGIAATISLMDGDTVTLFNGMMVADAYSNYFNIVFLGSAAITILASINYLDKEALQHPEYYVLTMFAALGMMLMASALDLIVIFIALEIMSLSVYILVGFRRADRRSNEAAMKYFILGSAASAILLYGVALLYGATGSMNIHTILTWTTAHGDTASSAFMLGAWLVILGFLFKVASVPFHMWMPDVYEGAPAPVTGFMTTGLKAAAFATFVRVFISMGYGKGVSTLVSAHFHDILWVVAVLTMVVGNVVALTQTNLKRLLAYSSIAHTGYLLVGVISGQSDQGYTPVVLYLAVYAVMNLGAFIILTVLSTKNDGGLNLHDFSGLSRRHPWIAFSMAVFLLSMAGIPPTAGFAAKYLLLYSAVQSGEVTLVVISVLCSAISVYYYLRVLVYMYMRDPVSEADDSRVSVWSSVAVAAMVALTLQIGILPAKMVTAARKAVTSL